MSIFEPTLDTERLPEKKPDSEQQKPGASLYTPGIVHIVIAFVTYLRIHDHPWYRITANEPYPTQQE